MPRDPVEEAVEILGHSVEGIHSASKELAFAESISGLPIAPIEDALDSVPPEPEWRWQGYLAPGAITLLAGRPKVGKSTTTFGLLEAVVAGRPFLGLPTRSTRVLLLSEERETTLAEKRERYRVDGGVDLLMRHCAGDRSWPEIVEGATAHCLANDVGLLVVDVWDKWVALRGDAETGAGYVLEALAPVERAAAQGLAVLVVAHQRKAEGKHGEAVRGSNALAGGVDVILELERMGAEPSARVLRASSRYAATPEELTLVLSEDGFAAADKDSIVGAADYEQIRQAAVKFAAEGNFAPSAEELAEGTGLPRATVGGRLKARSVERVGRGVKGDPHRWRVIHSANPHPLPVERNEPPLRQNSSEGGRSDGHPERRPPTCSHLAR